jgi:hypothetical protein
MTPVDATGQPPARHPLRLLPSAAGTALALLLIGLMVLFAVAFTRQVPLSVPGLAHVIVIKGSQRPRAGLVVGGGFALWWLGATAALWLAAWALQRNARRG